MNQKIAVRLVEYRLAAGLSQEKLAERLNVSRQAVSKWERAESLPDIGNIVALADLYGVTVDELLREPKSEEPACLEAEACADGPVEDEGRISDRAEDVLEAEPEETKPPCGKRRTWPRAVAATVCVLLVVTSIGAVSRLAPMAFSVEAPFAKEMAEYKPSLGFPWASLSDEGYTAEGEGSCTASGYVSALYLDWPEGKASIRAVADQETQGAIVVRDKTAGSGTAVRWRQKGGQLVVFQERDESGTPVATSLPEVLKPEVEILVPQSINLLDLLQMRVGEAMVDVEGFYLLNLRLLQDSGGVSFFQNDVMQSSVEVNGGTLSMKDSSSRSMDLLQREGTSTVFFEGAAPPTMNVTVEGGDATVWLGADEGCQVKLDRSGDSVFDFAFDTATQSGDIYNAGNMETFIDAKLSGGRLSVGTRGIRGINEL